MEISEKSEFALGLVWERGATPETNPAARDASALFEQHRAPLFRYLLSFGLAAQDCEEIIQEVFLSLFLHLRAGKPRHNLPGWIFRVGHNLGLKRRSRLLGTPVALAFDHSEPDPEPNAEQQLMASQRQDRLRAVVAALAEQDRQCLFLRAEGLRYREIAAVLGVSLGTVSACLVRALDKLRRAGAGGAN